MNTVDQAIIVAKIGEVPKEVKALSLPQSTIRVGRPVLHLPGCTGAVITFKGYDIAIICSPRVQLHFRLAVAICKCTVSGIRGRVRDFDEYCFDLLLKLIMWGRELKGLEKKSEA